MTLLDTLRAHRLLAIVRGPDPQAALDSVLTLADSGVHLIEVSLTAAGALDTIARARAALGPGFALGAGTVLTETDARQAADAGATFLVTPAIAPSLAEAARLGLPALAGALTPSEVVQATLAGAAAVKLFPASIGGPGYLRALRDPFPQTAFVPVGGVDATLAPQYLQAGAVAVGVGSPLLGDAVRGGDLAALRERAQAFLAGVAA
ncbi:bifunctional 4-hydroxy-2-oxoglutarate aldolase/2-dehydro-3-deoxy-phosphogluconate aldolase [Catellatospora aurea]|uniref:Bifunctional 4-hydroxy-2-oxoglutarate aldolase/2-dehydro-3-deoxy-phosphogluconate aldolase n=1 Tax=Catellatospora aurea TaxID=1337874 RepID=A0ABW2H494_9ACTN